MKKILQNYKLSSGSEVFEYCIPIKIESKICGRLRPVTIDIIKNQPVIEMLSNWRSANKTWFTTVFPVTEDGTRKWLENIILQSDDRILFILEYLDHTPVGQVGLFNYDEHKKQCEFDNLIRGRSKLPPNFIFYAGQALLRWSFHALELKTGYLRVFSDNERAIQLYQKWGFREILRVPLIKVTEGEVTKWVPVMDQPYYEAERYMMTMRINRDDVFTSCSLC